MKQKCELCHKEIKSDCNWGQGRCPHVPSMVDEILSTLYKTRFYNLFKFFRRNKDGKTN